VLRGTLLLIPGGGRLTSATKDKTKREIPSKFPHVKGLGGKEAEAAANSLFDLYKALRHDRVEPAAQRVRKIDDVVETLPFPVIERLLAPERVLAEYDEARNQPVHKLHSRRNQVALMPLVLTWLSIGLAVLLQNSTGLVPLYGAVAVVDAVLIGLVVLMTWQVHAKEQEAAEAYDKVARLVDVAVRSLAVAMEHHASRRAPANAEEWAVAAREVLEEARKQTAELFEATSATIEKANDNLSSVHDRTEDLVKLLADQSRKTLDSLQQANEQMATRVAKEAIAVLNSAVAEDRALVSEQLAPLVEQFQANVESFARSYDTYQENTAAFVAVTSDVGVATKVLGDSAKSYSDIAGSIDTHLRNIEDSQQHFIQRVTESARTMGTAASSMEAVSTLLSDQLRADLAAITNQLNSSSARLAAVDANLGPATKALSEAAMEMQQAAVAIGNATRHRSIWPWGR
jgi:hypothetical protein